MQWSGALSHTIGRGLAKECGLEGLPLQPAVDTSNCQGIRTLENCSQQCLPGYQPEGDGSLTCQRDRRFSASSFTCQPDACGDLSAVPSFSSPAYDSSCPSVASRTLGSSARGANRSFGETCAVFCRLGWRLEGNVSSMQCMALGSNGFASGFVRYFAENRSSIAAEDAQGPNCVALECTENLPDLSALHDCLGKRTGESCRVRAAPGYVAEPPETELMCWEGTFQGLLSVDVKPPGRHNAQNSACHLSQLAWGSGCRQHMRQRHHGDGVLGLLSEWLSWSSQTL